MMKQILFVVFTLLPIGANAQDDLFGSLLGGFLDYMGSNAEAEANAFGSGFAAGWRIGSADVKNVPDGFHKTDYENGKYEGYYKDGKRNGKGTYTWSDGEKYTGQWKDGYMHGKGVLITANKYKYEGDFNYDTPHGQGTLITPDGTKYTGGFFNGTMNGIGTLYSPHQKKYIKGKWNRNELMEVIQEGTYTPQATRSTSTNKRPVRKGKAKR